MCRQNETCLESCCSAERRPDKERDHGELNGIIARHLEKLAEMTDRAAPWRDDPYLESKIAERFRQEAAQLRAIRPWSKPA